MKKKTKTSRTSSRVAKSAAKKKPAKLSTAKPRVGFTPGAVVLRLSKQQLRLLTGSGFRTIEVIAEPYKVYRTRVGCGGGSPTGPWVFWPIENLEFE